MSIKISYSEKDGEVSNALFGSLSCMKENSTLIEAVKIFHSLYALDHNGGLSASADVFINDRIVDNINIESADQTAQSFQTIDSFVFKGSKDDLVNGQNSGRLVRIGHSDYDFFVDVEIKNLQYSIILSRCTPFERPERDRMGVPYVILDTKRESHEQRLPLLSAGLVHRMSESGRSEIGLPDNFPKKIVEVYCPSMSNHVMALDYGIGFRFVGDGFFERLDRAKRLE